jgi:hypothetical protein
VWGKRVHRRKAVHIFTYDDGKDMGTLKDEFFSFFLKNMNGKKYEVFLEML